MKHTDFGGLSAWTVIQSGVFAALRHTHSKALAARALELANFFDRGCGYLHSWGVYQVLKSMYFLRECGVWVRWFRTALFQSVIVIVMCSVAFAETIWRIGNLDESSGEFRPWIDPVTGVRLNYADPQSDAVYVVGPNASDRNWNAYQPGSANGGAGFRRHPSRIEFNLAEAPRGRCRLTLSLLAYSARLPVIEVQVNGRTGRYFQHPTLSYQAGDPAVFFLPYYGASKIVCDFPPGFLKSGTNSIILTAVDEPGERDDTRPSGFPWPGSSGVHYDALQLEHFNEANSQGGSSDKIEIVPTIYYQNADGALRERVDVFVRSGSRPEGVVLQIGTKIWTNAIQSEGEFGEWRSEFLVPEFFGPVEARVEVRHEGRRQELAAKISPARKWTLFVVPNIHIDVGYTDYAPKVSEIHSRILDRAMELAEQDPGFRFTPDGFWAVEEYWRGRTEDERQRLVESIRRGTISIPAVHSSPFTGFASLENLIRQLYPSKRFSVANGTPFDFALSTDVPNYSWSFASVLAASGIKYFAAASDAYRAPFLLYNRFNEVSPQFWEGPDGGRVLTWYSRHYHQLSSLFGLPYHLQSGRDSLPRFLQAYDRSDYPSDAVIVYGSQVENVELHRDHATLVKEWNARQAYPKLQYASFPEALDYISKSRTKIPTVRGDGGPYWEDGLGANARTTALARENMYRILSAEKISTVATLARARFAADAEMLEGAWRNLRLIDEHTWHSDQSVREPTSEQARRQGALKGSRAIDAQRQIEHVRERGFAALADEIKAPPGTIVVFNPLSWERGGVVEMDLSKGMAVVDPETNETVPMEVVGSGNGFHRVRFEARRVPAMGYKCFSVRSGAGPKPSTDVETPGVLENSFYRVELDPKTGRIRSVVDRALGRELVQQKPGYDLNEYLYVSGGDGLPNRLVQYSTVSPLPKLTIHRSSENGRLVFAKRSELGLMARSETRGMNTPRVETDIFLPHDEKRIEMVNRVTKDYSLKKEGVYFAFPFALEKPRFRWATQNGFVDPRRDLLNGAGREWFMAHQWLELGSEAMQVAWVSVDAPLFTVGDIALGAWPMEFGERPATIFSYVMNNYTPEGYQAGQEGEHLFRYVVTSGRESESDVAARYRLGMEALTPLEVNEITRNDKPAVADEWLPFPKGSFLEIDQQNVSLITWKKAEFAKGTVLRLLETGGLTNSVRLRFPWHRIESAYQCSAVEDQRAAVAFDGSGIAIEVRPHQIVTLRVELEASRRPRN